MSSSRLNAIHRFAGIFVCACDVLIAPSVSAFPIYTTQPETRIDFSPQAAPVVADSTALTDVALDFRPQRSGVSDSPLADSSPRLLATMQTGTSSSTRIEDYPLTLATPLAAPPVPELESLTIGGMQYSSGLNFYANDCSGKPAIGPCDTIEDAFFDLALAWTAELGRDLSFREGLSRI
jgi:hypothetical protein